MSDSPTEDLAELRIGRLLNGKWLLESLLGVGGTAAVYAATHRNGARVAIKILHQAISASEEARRRFKREGYIVNRIEHPGVVRVLDDDVDETDGSAFIVMDRADGISLCDRAHRRLLDESEVLEVVAQLLEILVAAHAKGVIHRDLKPDNLLVDEAGRVRLLDFGIARLLDDDANLTRTGFTFGTPAYMAPEQAMGKKRLIGPRTDLYAVGATMFTMLTGEYVHEAENAQALLIQIATQPARSLADVRPDSSPELVTLVDRATMMHLEDRWPSAALMLARVRRVMQARHLDASRRHISSRISAMITSVHAPASEPAGDRESVIRGLHPAAAVSKAETNATPLSTTTTRPSLLRARPPTNRGLAIASLAAVLLIGAMVGWTRPDARAATAGAASQTSEAAIRVVMVVSEAMRPTQPPPKSLETSPETSPASPLEAAVLVASPAATQVVTPALASTASPTPKPKVPAPRRIRRKIDVGY